jgi:Flp pilus assembly protein TadD
MRKGYLFGGAVVIVGTLAAALSSKGPVTSSAGETSTLPALSATSRESLEMTIERSRARVDADPGDGEAAVVLADALVRAARVRSDGSLALEAEQVLRRALQHNPSDYGVRRMQGVVYLAQHRFDEALRLAREAETLRPDDPWNDAVAGDALIELGQYVEAFDAFDALVSRRPDAAAYARVAYARELQGDLAGAEALMRMAAESTAPQDLEARAWVSAQLGNLYLVQRRFGDAEREFARAEFTFPSHPYAAMGRARLHIARGELIQALHLVKQIAETPESLALTGDLHARLGDLIAAEASYRQAERLERDGWQYEQPQPAALARFLAERRRDIPAAVSLAEAAAAKRQDIYTLDALAWSYFRAGRVEDASAAIRKATRTGTLDRGIRCHEAAIEAARGGTRTDQNVCDPLGLLEAGHAVN